MEYSCFTMFASSVEKLNQLYEYTHTPNWSVCWSEVKWSEVKSLSRVRLFVIPWTVAYKAPLSMEFSRQEYWSGLPFPSPGDLPDPGLEPLSLASPALTGGFFTTNATWEGFRDMMKWFEIWLKFYTYLYASNHFRARAMISKLAWDLKEIHISMKYPLCYFLHLQ